MNKIDWNSFRVKNENYTPGKELTEFKLIVKLSLLTGNAGSGKSVLPNCLRQEEYLITIIFCLCWSILRIVIPTA